MFLVGSKESAYVFALSSAAVSSALARACAQGTITSCSCGLHPKRIAKQFKWAGCSDNIKFANNFGRKFMDGADSAHINDARLVDAFLFFFIRYKWIISYLFILFAYCISSINYLIVK